MGFLLYKELAAYAKTSCEMGLMGQGIDAFRPNDILTRAEVVTVISRLYDFANDDPEIYFVNHMAAMLEHGYITNTTRDMTELRGNIFIMLQRIADTMSSGDTE